MKIEEKTAVLATSLNIFLTIAKFTAFFFTGSIAILAESWHSFSDIATSFLVYLSLREKNKNPKAKVQEEESNALTPLGVKIKNFFLKVTLEQKVSFLIGCLLLYVSINIFRKIFLEMPSLVEKAVVPAGLIFIFFASCSYFVHKLEINVGDKSGSLGLIADGLHAKSDMIASLACGFSLILYSLGINLDRIVGGAIGLLIFSLAVEIIINVFIRFYKKDSKYIKLHSLQMSHILFKKQLLSKVFAKLESRYNLKRFFIIKTISFILLGGVFLGYLNTSLFTIGIDEEGILERFGKPVNMNKALPSGLHLKYPWPIDKVVKLKSKKIYQCNIGNTTDKNQFALLWTREHGAERHFLSGNNNFFYPYIVLHYKINNIFDFSYQHQDAASLLKEVSNRIISHIFSTCTFYEIATAYRKDMETDIKVSLQKQLNFLKTGIEIININIKDVHPPTFIADAFEDVIAALQNKEEMINNGYSYRNKSLPEVRGQALLDKAVALAYVNEEKQKAIGETKRFESQLTAFSLDKKIYFEKVYIETMKKALKDKKLILLDPEVKTPEIWLNFNKTDIPAIGGQTRDSITSSLENEYY